MFLVKANKLDIAGMHADAFTQHIENLVDFRQKFGFFLFGHAYRLSARPTLDKRRIFSYYPAYMAHKKAGGSTSNLRDSQGQRLGTKLYGGEHAKPGAIIVRQRGSKIRPGNGVRMGKDHTLYAVQSGTVAFRDKLIRTFTGAFSRVKFVDVAQEK